MSRAQPSTYPRLLGFSALYAFLLFVPYLQLLTVPANRAFLEYRLTTIAQIYAIIFAVAIALGSLVWSVDRFVLPRASAHWRALLERLLWAPWIAVGVGVVIQVFLAEMDAHEVNQAIVDFHGFYKWFWCSLTALLVISPQIWRWILRAGTLLLKLTAPLPLVVLIYFFSVGDTAQLVFRETPAWREETWSAEAPRVPGPVYFFLFDEWDRTRTFAADGSVAAGLPAMQRIAATATFYARATSTAGNTVQAIPNLLFGNRLPVSVAPDGRLCFDDGGPALCRNYQTSFGLFTALGMHTVAVGRGIDYEDLLAGEVDWAYWLPYDSGLRLGVRNMLKTHLGKACQSAHLPFNHLWDLKAYYVEMDLIADQRVHELALAAIREGGGNLFGYFHYLLPHRPFVYEREGVRADWNMPEPAYADGYDGNLRYLDTQLAEILQAIERSGHWDDCTLVLTADHGTFSDESHANTRTTEVPLIIKHPRQHTAFRSDAAIALPDLLNFIANSLRGRETGRL